MRTIKFRAWDKEGKEMFRVISISWPYAHTKSKVIEVIVCGRGGCIKNPILMQFTGLHDKYGKEIWEGDVVRYMNSESIGVVEYDLSNVGGCRFFINSKEERTFEDEMGVKFAWFELEILGNIYSNPELLEAK